MRADLDELCEKYPSGFPVEDLPEEAREERITVYRVCRSGNVEPSSFLPTYLDELAMTKENAEAKHDIGHYSWTCYQVFSACSTKPKSIDAECCRRY